jgi:hypothetical protein
MAKQVGPARGKPTTSLAVEGRFHRLAPSCADSIMAGGVANATTKRPQIRLQSVLFAASSTMQPHTPRSTMN